MDGAAYRSFNCWTLPRERHEITLVMQYVTAVTVVLAYFRIGDHRQDSRGLGRKLGWAVAARALSSQYVWAAEQLRTWEFPLDEMSALLATQVDRELKPPSVRHVAEPTMVSTAMAFSHGVKLAGYATRAGEAWQLGFKFRELIYLLDALEDRESDKRSGHFNPLLAFPEEFAPAGAGRESILAIAADLEQAMTPAHAARLRMNLEERLGMRPRVVYAACRESLTERARQAAALAR